MSGEVEFLRARYDEEEARAIPGTVSLSGGFPAPEVLVCDFGLTYDQPGKPDGWKLDVSGIPRAEQKRIAREHERIHADPRALREVEAKRSMLHRHVPEVAAGARRQSCWHDGQYWPCADVMSFIAIYSDHGEYHPEWKR